MRALYARWRDWRGRRDDSPPESITGSYQPDRRDDSAAGGGGLAVPNARTASEVCGPIAVPQIVIGAPSPDVEPVVIAEGYRTVPFRPDTLIDGWSTDRITVRGASLRGHFHRYNGAPRQDEFAVHQIRDGRVIAIVADGVSQAAQSHIGASSAVRYAAQWLQSQIPDQAADIDWRGLVKSTAWALVEQAQSLLNLCEPDPAKAEQELATTLVCAVVEPARSGVLNAHIVGVGDSGAWLLRDGDFIAVTGGKPAGNGGISTSVVSGLPRVPTELEPSVVEFGPRDVLLLGTDGIGDPLGSGQGGVGNLFRELLGGPPPSLYEFAHAVDFSRETFDDDRTLVAVWAREPLTPPGFSEPPGRHVRSRRRG